MSDSGGPWTHDEGQAEAARAAKSAKPVNEGPEWAAWNWSGGSRSFSWPGVFLVLIGVALFVQWLKPEIGLTSLLLLALGLAFLAAWALGGAKWAFLWAALLLALAAGRLVRELGYVAEDADGWTALFLGVGLLLSWLVGSAQGVRRSWALWIGAIMTVIGVAQVSDRIPGLPDLGWLWPAAIVVLGVLLLIRARVAEGPGQRV